MRTILSAVAAGITGAGACVILMAVQHQRPDSATGVVGIIVGVGVAVVAVRVGE